MQSAHQTFIGIDVQAIQKPFFFTALDADLEIIASGHGRLGDVLAYLAGQSSVLVSVNGPVCAPQPDIEFSQGGLFDSNQFSAAGSNRSGDAALAARGYPAALVPAAGKKLPLWIERSLELAGEMRRLGYAPSSETNLARTYFETQTEAAYWQVTGIIPYDARSLEGRLQYQLMMFEFGFALRDPMTFLEEFTRFRLRTSQLPLTQILPAHELRSLMAAATAWLMDTHPEKVEHFGMMGEGEIILPREFTRK
ncbi:MAG TPA: hypothetical protein VF338_06515 [Leptolinea sp.]